MGGDHRSAAIEAQADTILSLLAEQPDATLVEYQEALAKTGHRFSVSTIWRFFDRRELTLKNVWPAPSARGFVEIACDQSASTYPASEASSRPRWRYARSGAS